jgi:hypothetical protein
VGGLAPLVGPATTVAPVALDAAGERSVRRRVTVIWALLFFNVLEYIALPTVFAIPHTIAKVATQTALGVALLLALTVNRRLVIRPNTLLALASLLAASSLMISIRGEVSRVGSDVRAGRLIGFVLVLWLLTPWWGRRDLMLTRVHLRCLVAVLAMVVAGLLLSPHLAFTEGRLYSDIWPIAPTQVAHYAAEVAGITAVMWLAGILSRRSASILFPSAVVILLLTHTRTALIAMVVGICVASLSLFAWRQRVRRVLLTALVVLVLGGVLFAPAVTNWFNRGENTTELTDLSGRTLVWSQLVNTPRSEGQVIFGFGLSNGSFQGLPIDNSWLATYQDQGLFGDVIDGLMLASLLVLAWLRPRSPQRAIALFILVYSLIASFTETGLGTASPYMLDLAVAGSLLATPQPQPFRRRLAPGVRSSVTA